MDLLIVLGRILEGFWPPFSFHLGAQNRLQDSSRLLLGHGVPPQGRPRAFGASQSSQKSIPKLPKWSPGDPQGSQNEPLGSDGAPQTVPGSHPDAGKRPEARRRPRGPQNNSRLTRKLPNRSFKSIKESGPILGLRIYQKSFESL